MYRELHRITYMGERQGYWERRLSAVRDPINVLSTISDGMQQSHNQLPHQSGAGSQHIQQQLDIHLQGVISHGKNKFFMFRHFGNIGKGASANVAIHAWLRVLEMEIQANNGTLPDTIYHQIDGGSENANLTTLAIAELLVHRGLCKKVVLTRLPVGHT